MVRPNVAGPWRRVLWSGGMDSTAHVLEQLAAGARVDALYVETGHEDWQKHRREQDARDRIVSALPADWRRRLEVSDTITQASVWPVYCDEWDRVSEASSGGPFSPQLPLLLAAARLVDGAAAGYVSNDRPFARRLANDAKLSLPIASRSKADTLAAAAAAGFADLLALTWSCEANDDESDVWPCGRCDPCRARLIPQTVRTR